MIDTRNLLKLIATGDEDAFANLYRANYGKLMIFTRCVLGRRQSEAEDVLNDAFVAIWHGAKKFQSSGSADGWIKRIVRNKAIDLLRKKYDEPYESEILIEKVDNSAENNNSFGDRLAKFSRNELFGALARLSIEHREAIYLFYFDELSIDEIGAICDCSQNTIKTRLFYGKKRLKSLLQNSEMLERFL